VNKYPLKEIFKIHGGNSVLTEKIIYENQAKDPKDNIAVYSSATEEAFSLPKVDKNLLINDKHIKTFSKDKSYIIIARNGKAGLMNIISGIDFTINDHAYVMELKKPFIDKMNLEYFIFKYQLDFLGFVSGKSNNATFSKEISENYEIEIEPIGIQNKFIKIVKTKYNIRNHISNNIVLINEQLEKVIKPSEKTKKFLMSELFNITSGVRITQKEVYQNAGDLPIITSQTSNNGIAWYGDRQWLSTFRKNGKSLIFTEPCITWTKEGNAGKMFYRDYDFFSIDVSGILTLKRNININFHWFMVTFQSYFYTKVTSQGGQGKLYEEQMANIEVEIPVKENGEIDIDLQNEIYAEYKRLADIKEKLESLINKYSL